MDAPRLHSTQQPDSKCLDETLFDLRPARIGVEHSPRSGLLIRHPRGGFG
jgi:hypothetical protein